MTYVQVIRMPIELNFVGKKTKLFLRKTQNFRDIKRNYLEKSVSFAKKMHNFREETRNFPFHKYCYYLNVIEW